jgi:hypothetical protein
VPALPRPLRPLSTLPTPVVLQRLLLAPPCASRPPFPRYVTSAALALFRVLVLFSRASFLQPSLAGVRERAAFRTNVWTVPVAPPIRELQLMLIVPAITANG